MSLKTDGLCYDSPEATVSKPPNHTILPDMWDVFISHAHEDKETAARPIADSLRALGFTVWLDEYELQIGDSLSAKIDEGLRCSRYGIVILSQHFFSRHWPKIELDALATREANGTEVILPVWHGIDRASVEGYSAILANKVAVSTTIGTANVVAKIVRKLGRPTVPDSTYEPRRGFASIEETGEGGPALAAKKPVATAKNAILPVGRKISLGKAILVTGAFVLLGGVLVVGYQIATYKRLPSVADTAWTGELRRGNDQQNIAVTFHAQQARGIPESIGNYAQKLDPEAEIKLFGKDTNSPNLLRSGRLNSCRWQVNGLLSIRCDDDSRAAFQDTRGRPFGRLPKMDIYLSIDQNTAELIGQCDISCVGANCLADSVETWDIRLRHADYHGYMTEE